MIPSELVPNRKRPKKDENGRDSCQKKSSLPNRQDRKDEDIQYIGNQKIPFKYGDCAHDNPGIHHEAIMVCDTAPEGWSGWLRREAMIGREEKDGGDQGRKCDSPRDRHDQRQCLPINGNNLVVEESVKEMSNQKLELTSALPTRVRSHPVARSIDGIGYASPTLMTSTSCRANTRVSSC